jgi:hypothetical protein
MTNTNIAKRLVNLRFEFDTTNHRRGWVEPPAHVPPYAGPGLRLGPAIGLRDASEWTVGQESFNGDSTGPIQ